jgi:hypothetical protein
VTFFRDPSLHEIGRAPAHCRRPSRKEKIGQVQESAKAVRREDVWHLDQVVISIAGKKALLWRAVDRMGMFLSRSFGSRRFRSVIEGKNL